LLIAAGPEQTDTLLSWGTDSDDEGSNLTRSGSTLRDPRNPGVISDVFVRIGGAEDPIDEEKKADTAIQINSDSVIIDNIWAWRADHDVNGSCFAPFFGLILPSCRG
jgi:hypothetical protein